MAILVCGGAGYIGSHTVAKLLENYEKVVVFDNLVKGHKKALLGGEFVKGDIRDKDKLLDTFKAFDIEAVINFAAFSEAGESVRDPLKFYNNNVYGCISLLDAMKEAGIKTDHIAPVILPSYTPESVLKRQLTAHGRGTIR